MKCHLASLDSVDWCVMTNLVWFFRRLGFSVSWSKALACCDVLVLVRGCKLPPISSDVFGSVKALVVFDYVGNDQIELLSAVSKFGKPILHFRSCGDIASTAESKQSGSIESIRKPLPVNVRFWRKKPTTARWRAVYVGNRKNLPSDECSADLDLAISSGTVDVWGRWWTGLVPDCRLHKPITVYSVPSVYSRSEVTLGLMYPFQREHGCYSSRQWLAPLAGCVVVSECENSFHAPGVVTRKGGHYYPERVQVADRENLAIEASSFWETHTDHALSHVADWLANHQILSRKNVSQAAARQRFTAASLMTLLRGVSLIERVGISLNRDIAPMSWLRIWN
jgi:hypothetical protein